MNRPGIPCLQAGEDVKDIGDLVVDPFAGSGTCGEACRNLDRNCVLSDISEIALGVIRKRLNLEEST